VGTAMPTPSVAMHVAGKVRRTLAKHSIYIRSALTTLDEWRGHFSIFKRYDKRTLLYAGRRSPLPPRIHVSGLDDIWHISLSLNTGNVVTFETTDLSLPTDLVV
jgi:hypothetical protein